MRVPYSVGPPHVYRNELLLRPTAAFKFLHRKRQTEDAVRLVDVIQSMVSRSYSDSSRSMRALIIASPWVEAIAAGRKVWELRGSRLWIAR
jgi:hypothetical protein